MTKKSSKNSSELIKFVMSFRLHVDWVNMQINHCIPQVLLVKIHVPLNVAHLQKNIDNVKSSVTMVTMSVADSFYQFLKNAMQFFICIKIAKYYNVRQFWTSMGMIKI